MSQPDKSRQLNRDMQRFVAASHQWLSLLMTRGLEGDCDELRGLLAMVEDVVRPSATAIAPRCRVAVLGRIGVLTRLRFTIPGALPVVLEADLATQGGRVWAACVLRGAFPQLGLPAVFVALCRELDKIAAAQKVAMTARRIPWKAKGAA